MRNSEDEDTNGAGLNIRTRNLQLPSYTWAVILYFVIFLTVPGAILAGLGYNNLMDRVWGHLGLASLIIGSIVCSCAFSYVIWFRKEPVAEDYQSLGGIDLPTSSDSDNPVTQHENRLLRALQCDEPSTSDQDSSRDQAAQETIALLKAAGISETEPSSSASPPQSTESESARQSKSSIYVSTELPQNESSESATESEAKSLLPQTDTKLQAQFEATI